ncbi:N-acetyl-1-D-myo-inositol-2-amino-2-deoxy-alpha-D-glucopyranoside deacetylase [Haloechinothrix sp. LS1_15]|uniref:N-acetyl-1-D-myo-inositol-2-amino-2-deoxy-alpha- D-glucopyranoside deacetylase n=1 Tax=Haloechinothrix sp. LS1_15 TaxID=2652248 RepID=UPI00294B5F9C|nr:N-acetyl-1-D-myo-inositol-2-amino-2-deoxy-alpha-D-glucopyranoside deacetylase [Haloechinothrix sp. LS1_15]
MDDRLLLVHAHPDDESLTTGGTIARYAAAGVEVTLVTCTLGEEGEIIPPELGQLGADAADQLGGYRAGELQRACAALGVHRHYYLGGIGRWRDSGMAGSASARHPRALVAGAIAEQVEQLRAVLDEVRPQVVVTYDADGGYGHPDHIRAHEITMAATADADPVRRVLYTVVPRTPAGHALAALREYDGLPFTVPDLDELPVVADERAHVAVDVAGHTDARLRALQAHRTQVSVWRDQAGNGACFALSNGMALPNADTEYFELARDVSEDGTGPRAGGAVLAQHPEVATDLFGGIR